MQKNLTRVERTHAAAHLAVQEYLRAIAKFPKLQASAHESYAVLLEEVDELWDAIKANDLPHARKEAIQVAAMAIRFIIENPLPEEGEIIL